MSKSSKKQKDRDFSLSERKLFRSCAFASYYAYSKSKIVDSETMQNWLNDIAKNCKWFDSIQEFGEFFDRTKIIQGYTGIDRQNNTLYIVFKGSQEVIDWLRDFNFFQVELPRRTKPYSILSRGARVHRGFFNAYDEEIRKDKNKKLENTVLDYIRNVEGKIKGFDEFHKKIFNSWKESIANWEIKFNEWVKNFLLNWAQTHKLGKRIENIWNNTNNNPINFDEWSKILVDWKNDLRSSIPNEKKDEIKMFLKDWKNALQRRVRTLIDMIEKESDDSLHKIPNDLKNHLKKSINTLRVLYHTCKVSLKDWKTTMDYWNRPRIVVTGHSLGAGFAILCAEDIGITLELKKGIYGIETNSEIRCVLFGCPRVGNLRFAKYYKDLSDKEEFQKWYLMLGNKHPKGEEIPKDFEMWVKFHKNNKTLKRYLEYKNKIDEPTQGKKYKKQLDSLERKGIIKRYKLFEKNYSRGRKFPKKLHLSTYRLSNGNDFATKIPPWIMGWKHVGTPCYIGRKRIHPFLNPLAHHHIKYKVYNYYKGEIRNKEGFWGMLTFYFFYSFLIGGFFMGFLWYPYIMILELYVFFGILTFSAFTSLAGDIVTFNFKKVGSVLCNAVLATILILIMFNLRNYLFIFAVLSIVLIVASVII